MRKVVIVNKVLPQYRGEFFSFLRDELRKHNIELEVIYGKDNKINALKKDEVELDWAKYVPNKVLKIGHYELVWQPCWHIVKDADLVIVENANRFLLNYYLILARSFSKFRLAYWGHGRNLQDDADSWANRFKYLFLNKCDWWFAYTNLTKRILVSHRYPADRITVVQNAIDTRNIQNIYSNIPEQDMANLCKELGVRNGYTALYCGSMYPEKNFGFILETCYRVKRAIPDFHMIFMGSGVESEKVIKAARGNDWIHYVGPKFGSERVKYFKLSSIQIMPYYLGLAIVDSFALQTPIITTSNPYHGPEIDYLANGINGFMTNDSIDDFSAKVIDTLQTGSYNGLIEGCRQSAGRITLETMVGNFRDGVLECLDTKMK